MAMSLSDIAPIAFWQRGAPSDPGRSFRIAMLAEVFQPGEMGSFRVFCQEVADAFCLGEEAVKWLISSGFPMRSGSG